MAIGPPTFGAPKTCREYRAANNGTPTVEELMSETVESIFLKAGADKYESLSDCIFQGVRFECGNKASDMFDKYVQKCFLIDVKEVQAKQDLGLEVKMTNQMAFDPGSDLFKDGFTYLQLQDRFDPFSEEKLLLQKGMHTKIAMRKVSYRLLNSKRSSPPQVCKRGFLLDSYNVSYTGNACEADCIQTFVTESCSCLMPIDSRFLKPETRKTAPCSGTLERGCVVPKLAEIASAAQEVRNGSKSQLPEKFEKFEKCSRECHQPCEYTEFLKTVTTANLKGWSDHVLEVAFDSLMVQQVEQQFAISPAVFISNLGKFSVHEGSLALDFLRKKGF